MIAALPFVLAALLSTACPVGCVLGDGALPYRVTTADAVQLGRAVECETGMDDPAAVAWTMVQNFHRRRLAGRHESLHSFVAAYSSCSSPRWARSNHPRIGPRARHYSRLDWHELSERTRRFVSDFLAGLHPNRWPGTVYFLAASFANQAPREWGEPSFTRPKGHQARNAYFHDPSTVGWTTGTVLLWPGWRMP